MCHRLPISIFKIWLMGIENITYQNYIAQTKMTDSACKKFYSIILHYRKPKEHKFLVQKCVCVFYKKKNCALFCPCRLYNREKCTCNWEQKDILANGVSNFCTRRKRYFGKWSNIIDFSNAISIPVWTLVRRAQLFFGPLKFYGLQLLENSLFLLIGPP